MHRGKGDRIIWTFEGDHSHPLMMRRIPSLLRLLGLSHGGIIQPVVHGSRLARRRDDSQDRVVRLEGAFTLYPPLVLKAEGWGAVRKARAVIEVCVDHRATLIISCLKPRGIWNFLFPSMEIHLWKLSELPVIVYDCRKLQEVKAENKRKAAYITVRPEAAAEPFGEFLDFCDRISWRITLVYLSSFGHLSQSLLASVDAGVFYLPSYMKAEKRRFHILESWTREALSRGIETEWIQKPVPLQFPFSATEAVEGLNADLIAVDPFVLKSVFTERALFGLSRDLSRPVWVRSCLGISIPGRGSWLGRKEKKAWRRDVPA